MRLLDVETFEVKEFLNNKRPVYAILSHTWEEEEVVFSDLTRKDWKFFAIVPEDATSRKRGWDKVRAACFQAQTNNISHIWIDSLCIDKSSSSELSEAINSMHRWYEEAIICYAYLEDIDSGASDDPDVASSRWFTRGWTLQELLAPKEVIFYDKHWLYLGTKAHHKDKTEWIEMLSRRTKIQPSVLTGKVSVHSQSVACRMSWASNRQTTRTEDTAYCLLGIFGLNMPLLYGEGDKAFDRLQREILKETDDHSIFAWDFGVANVFDLKLANIGFENAAQGILPLASSPKQFAKSNSIVCTPPSVCDQFGQQNHQSFRVMPGELHVNLPLVQIGHSVWNQREVATSIAIIGCMSQQYPEHNIGIVVSRFCAPAADSFSQLARDDTASTYRALQMFRRTISSSNTISATLVPLVHSRRAQLQDIRIGNINSLHAGQESWLKHWKLHRLLLLRISSRARANGLASPFIVMPKQGMKISYAATAATESVQAQSGADFEITWPQSIREVVLCFDLINDDVDVRQFTVTIGDIQTSISQIKDNDDTIPLGRIYTRLGERSIPVGETKAVLGRYTLSLKQDFVAVYSQHYKRLEVDLEPRPAQSVNKAPSAAKTQTSKKTGVSSKKKKGRSDKHRNTYIAKMLETPASQEIDMEL